MKLYVYSFYMFVFLTDKGHELRMGRTGRKKWNLPSNLSTQPVNKMCYASNLSAQPVKKNRYSEIRNARPRAQANT